MVCVRHTEEPCKIGWTDRDAVLVADSCAWAQEISIKRESRFPTERDSSRRHLLKHCPLKSIARFGCAWGHRCAQIQRSVWQCGCRYHYCCNSLCIAVYLIPVSYWRNLDCDKAGVEGNVRYRQSKKASISLLRSHHEETRELPGERDNAKNNVQMHVGEEDHARPGLTSRRTRLPVEESIRITDINAESTSMIMANPRIEDG